MHSDCPQTWMRQHGNVEDQVALVKACGQEVFAFGHVTGWSKETSQDAHSVATLTEKGDGKLTRDKVLIRT
jgi:hypothetical protein